ncbi:MAG: tetratricopeptide repeat protein [Chloroflexota bacterium]
MDFLKRLFGDSSSQTSEPEKKKKKRKRPSHPSKRNLPLSDYYKVASLPADARQYFNSGIQKFADSDYIGAEADFVKANELAPWHRWVECKLIQTVARLRQLEHAEQMLQLFQDDVGNDVYLKILKPVLYEDLGFQERADTLFESLFQSPDKYLNYIGILWNSTFDEEIISRLLERLEEIDFTSDLIYRIKMEIPAHRADYETAIKIAEAGLDNHPNNIDLILKIVSYAIRLDDLQVAHDYLSQAENIDANNQFTRMARVEYDYFNEDYQSAYKLLRTMYREHQTSSLMLFYLGILHQKFKNFDDAIQIHSKYIASNRSDPSAYSFRAYSYQRLGKYRQALSDYDKAISLQTDYELALTNRCLLYLEHFKDYDKALQDAERLIELDKTRGYQLRASIFARQEKFDGAFGEYHRLLNKHPDNHLALNARAWLYAYVGDYDNALQDAERAVSLSPKSSYHYGTCGQVKWLLGNYKEALADFQQGYELEKEPVFKLESAVALLRLDRSGEALSDWHIALDNSDGYTTAVDFQDAYRFAPSFFVAMRELEALANAEASTDD